MLRRFSTIFILSFLLVAFMAMTAFAAKSETKSTRKFSPTIDKSLYYSYPDENIRQDGSSSATVGRSSYSKSASATSPGVAIGDTWYDYQHNGTIGQMIDWGPHSGATGDPLIHFGWMKLPGASFASRHYAYNHYNATTGLLGSVVAIQPGDEYAGYVQTHATSDNRGIPSGHNNQGGGYAPQIYWDFSPGFGFFSANSRVDDAVMSYPSNPGQEVIWPKMSYQEGTATVTHVVAQVSAAAAADPQSIYYFRKVGASEAGTWDYPPYVIDTIYDLSHDIVASRNSDKVALVWTGNLNYDNNGVQYPPGVCDTCSGTSPIHVQWDNDIYYQISDDQGVTWNPRVNVTLNRLGEAGFRPYTDLASCIDAQDNLHIVWSGVVWPADPASDGWGWNCRLFHWSEDNPYIRTAANADWAQTTCIPGAWNVNISKMQVSECDGKIYALYVQFNDIPNGVEDDCAARADGGSGDISGAANGELFIVVSGDGGLTWDAPRNLTNSYTPNCDPANGGVDCENDNWPSMTRTGRQNQGGESWGFASVVDPSGSYGGNYYLDVQYVHDRDAGGIVQNEGTWQLSNMNWFRLACVEPVPNPGLVMSPGAVGLPTWTQPGVQTDIALQIENPGNVNLTYSVSIEEDNGAAGWLNYSGLSGSVPSGLNNIETGTLHLNNGGVETADPAVLTGRLTFTSNAPSSPDVLEVTLIVAENVEGVTPDTVFSSCLALAVSNNGNYGNSGLGGVNLDYSTTTDCNENASVYLYDASPVILWDNGTDTAAYWSIFGDTWLDERGFRPQTPGSEGSEDEWNWYNTGTFTTQDSTIALEKTWYAPTGADCNFMVQKLKVWSFDGLAHNGLRIGEAQDWDTPSDSGADNSSGFDFGRNLIYQVGAEFDQSDTLADGSIDPAGDDCIAQDRRFGGTAFNASFLNPNGDYTSPHQTAPYSAYTARNDTFVFPAGNFLPGQLWENMDNSGFTTEADITDLHTVMCFEPSFNLGATDTIEFFMIVATVYDGTLLDLQTTVDNANAWITANDYFVPSTGCCMGAIRGNVDYDPGDGIDIGDLVYFVTFSFGGGPPPECLDEADVDASGGLDIGDIVYMVTFMFGGGPAPLPCP